MMRSTVNVRKTSSQTPRDRTDRLPSASDADAWAQRRSSSQGLPARPKGTAAVLPPLTPRVESAAAAADLSRPRATRRTSSPTLPPGRPSLQSSPRSQPSSIPEQGSVPRRTSSRGPTSSVTKRVSSAGQPSTGQKRGSSHDPPSTTIATGGPPKARTKLVTNRAEKVPMRPPVPVRVVFLRDGEEDGLRTQLQNLVSLPADDEANNKSSACSLLHKCLVVEGVGIRAQELLEQFQLQYCLPEDNCTATVENDSMPDERAVEEVAEKKIATLTRLRIGEWFECEGHVVTFRGESDRYVAAVLPKAPDGPTEVQIRVAQCQPPNNIAAWGDWARSAKHDAMAWMSRTSPPMLIDLPAPAEPATRMDVCKVNGAELVLQLRWCVPETARNLGTSLRWQYKWRKVEVSSSSWANNPGSAFAGVCCGTSDGSKILDDCSFQQHVEPATDAASCASKESEIGKLTSDERLLSKGKRNSEGIDFTIPGNSTSPGLAAAGTADSSNMVFQPLPRNHWVTSAYYESSLNHTSLEITSPWLYGEWASHAIECCIRYQMLDQPSLWSNWSGPSLPLKMVLAAPKVTEHNIEGGSCTIRVSYSDADPTTAKVTWHTIGAANPRVAALQYMVELRDDVPAHAVETSGAEATPTRTNQLIQTWEKLVVTEHFVRNAPRELSHRLFNLVPGHSYKVRVQGRHWSLDHAWRVALSASFEMPLPPCWYTGFPALIPLPDACMPQGESVLGGGMSRYPFWMPPEVAHWPDSMLVFEWRCECKHCIKVRTNPENAILEKPALGSDPNDNFGNRPTSGSPPDLLAVGSVFGKQETEDHEQIVSKLALDSARGDCTSLGLEGNKRAVDTVPKCGIALDRDIISEFPSETDQPQKSIVEGSAIFEHTANSEIGSGPDRTENDYAENVFGIATCLGLESTCGENVLLGANSRGSHDENSEKGSQCSTRSESIGEDDICEGIGSGWQRGFSTHPVFQNIGSMCLDGRGVALDLPTGRELLAIRCWHVAGAFCPSVRIHPIFRRPSAPTAILTITDAGPDVDFSGPLSKEARSHATYVQVRVTSTLGETGQVLVQEISPAALELPTGKRWKETILVEHIQGFASDEPGRCTVFGQVRIGDELRWSEWSETSHVLSLAIEPPQPLAETQVTVEELAADSASVMVSWPPFKMSSGLSRAIYTVAVAPVELPEAVILRELRIDTNDKLEPFCQLPVRRLIPGVEYAFSVSAEYPLLQKYCKAKGNPLTTIFETTSIDDPRFEPPPPPRQVVPPGSHGGVDEKAPWGWDFWFEVDKRCVAGLRGDRFPAYEVEWRTVGDNIRLATEADLEWNAVSLDLASTANPPIDNELVVCHFDLRAHCFSQVRTFSEDKTAEPPAEQVELRLRMPDQPGKIGVTSRLWRSLPSTPWVSAFAPVSKPKAIVHIAAPSRLQIVVRFAIMGVPPGAGPSLNEWQPVDISEGQPLASDYYGVPDGYGHRFADRLQFRHCVAGQQQRAESVKCLPAAALEDMGDVPSLSEPEDAVPAGWVIRAAAFDAFFPSFRDGEKHVFAVRVGDGFRWSAWSVWSKPVLIALPPINGLNGIQVDVLRTDRVACSWQPLRSSLSVPVECAVWVVQVGPDGLDVKDARQLILIHTELAQDFLAGPATGGTNQSDTPFERGPFVANIGTLHSGRKYRFALHARLVSFILGDSSFQEVATSEPILWPSSDVSTTGTHCVLESWDIPVPCPVFVPDELESSSGRWKGKTVLLSWPKGINVSEEPPLELQGCANCDDPAFGWAPVPWTVLRWLEIPYVMAGPLPFCCGRFRWYSLDRRIAGPRSEECLAAVDAPCRPCVESFCSPSAVRLRLAAELAGENHDSTPYCQVRFLQVSTEDSDGTAEPIGNWTVCDVEVMEVDEESEARETPRMVNSTLGSENGLELKRRYIFSVRVCDDFRNSPWSSSSDPVDFCVPQNMVPKSAKSGQLQVEAISETSVRFWWAELRTPAASNPRHPSLPSRQPQLECRLDVSRCIDNGGIERHATLLIGEGDTGSAPFTATVIDLLPESRYFAALAVRFLKVGAREWQKTGLTASFETPQSR